MFFHHFCRSLLLAPLHLFDSYFSRGKVVPLLRAHTRRVSFDLPIFIIGGMGGVGFVWKFSRVFFYHPSAALLFPLLVSAGIGCLHLLGVLLLIYLSYHFSYYALVQALRWSGSTAKREEIADINAYLFAYAVLFAVVVAPLEIPLSWLQGNIAFVATSLLRLLVAMRIFFVWYKVVEKSSDGNALRATFLHFIVEGLFTVVLFIVASPLRAGLNSILLAIEYALYEQAF